MDGSHSRRHDRPGRGPRTTGQWAPILWIVILLVAWFVIVEWEMLPNLISATMAALP
ncbi:MAG: hypothetical protein WDN25_29495 [Acetobacteraceae bacterium]